MNNDRGLLYGIVVSGNQFIFCPRPTKISMGAGSRSATPLFCISNPAKSFPEPGGHQHTTESPRSYASCLAGCGSSARLTLLQLGQPRRQKGRGRRGSVQSNSPVSLKLLPPDAKLPPRCKQKELLSCLAWLVIGTCYLTSEHCNSIVWLQVNLTHHGKVRKTEKVVVGGVTSACAVNNTRVL